MQPVISIDSLCKSYLVGHQTGNQERYSSFRDVLGRHANNFLRKGLDMLRGRQIIQGDEVEEFWALQNVSFEINRGEVVGIIGRNGAGKSTLLKILSRIVEPTKGRISLRGRVASLLEVGTGFHPELTGRENIFLNGAILGMSRREIKQKFDEIVSFAEVENFLDTPVKRYSSGMYVRLAFSVAAHLDPEILVVDEVLAVGDMQFQKKCLGRMEDLVSGGQRTVLFVSHNREAVVSLCSRVVALNSGRVVFDGGATQAFQSLSTQSFHLPFNSSLGVNDRTVRRGNGYVRFDEIQSNTEKTFVEITATVRVFNRIPRLEAWVILKTPNGFEILSKSIYIITENSADAGECFSFTIRLNCDVLATGEYPLYLWLGSCPNTPYDVIDGLLPPLILKNCSGNQSFGEYTDGCVHLPYEASAL